MSGGQGTSVRGEGAGGCPWQFQLCARRTNSFCLHLRYRPSPPLLQAHLPRVRLENSTDPGVIRIRGDRWFHEAGRRYLDACGGALFIAMVMNADALARTDAAILSRHLACTTPRIERGVTASTTVASPIADRFAYTNEQLRRGSMDLKQAWVPLLTACALLLGAVFPATAAQGKPKSEPKTGSAATAQPGYQVEPV